jgi:hypothetical protein
MPMQCVHLQGRGNKLTTVTSRRVQLEVEVMKEHRRLRVLLEVLKRIEYNR